MNKRYATIVMAAAALTVMGPACVSENTASVKPYAICSMPDDCTFDEKCGAQYLGPVKFEPNPAAGLEMLLAIEMHNQLTQNGTEDGSGQVNTHDAHFESYTVEYGDSGGLIAGSTAGIPSATFETQQVIPAAGSSVVSITPFPSTLISALDLAAVPVDPDYRTVDLTVTFKGRFDDGSTWEAPFRFPVRLCQGCISVRCDQPDQVAIGACPNLLQEPHGKPVCVAPTTP